MQTLILASHRRAMLRNGRAARAGSEIDPKPVVKLFCPWGAATWLLTELDPEEPDIAFGLCDLGCQSPELGSVRLSELRSIRGPFRLYIERDVHFRARETLSEYTKRARELGRIEV